MSQDQPSSPSVPSNINVATTAMPAHAAVATTAVPTHLNQATTAMPVAGGSAPTSATPRLSSHVAGDVLALGRFQLTIERLLYVGGQAELYVVSGGPEQRTVLKLYTQGARPKPDVLDRWRVLPHSAVIALLDADPFAEPRAWELLAFAEGGPLAGGGEAPLGPIKDQVRLRSIIQQSAAALHTLHTTGGVVHRDVSPDNFLWLDTARTRLVLSDLGSSSIMSGGAAKSGTIRGKLPFMAPEELLPMGDGVVVGEAADFYALGIMVLTLWAGQHPFVGREADQIALKSRGAVPMPPDLPPDLQSLAEALLLPANIRLTYDGIQRWLSGQAIPRAMAPRNLSYPRLTVRPAQGAPYEVDTPTGLARFLLDEPVAGERFLYAWNMREWASADAGLVADLTDIVEKEFPKNRGAGRQKAAYLLDATLPFAAPDGTICRDYAELSAWLEADPERPKGLVDPAHPLWLYLATRPENELREAMADLDADVRAGKPEATAVIRHYLMQFAAAGAWRDGDGTIVTELSTFLERLKDRAKDNYNRLLDPADPLTLWLETHLPGTAERVGRLRTLPQQARATLAPIDWISCALNSVQAIHGVTLLTPEDAWKDDLWARAADGEAGMGQFLDGWWRVVEEGRFGNAALEWLAGRPTTGARAQVTIALLADQWQVTGRPLSHVLATAFAALPAWSSDPANAKVVQAAGSAVIKQLEAIRDGADPEHQALVQLDAATALAHAASSARASAPGWWDALMAWIGGQLTDTVRAAFAQYRQAPNVLGDVIGRRTELQGALAPFRMPVLARWSAEDTRRKALEQELAVQEGRQRDARLQAINDKAIELRGTPHVATINQLKTTQPPLARKLFRTGLAGLVGFTAYTIGAWMVRHVDMRRFSENDVQYLIPILGAMVIMLICTWIAVRAWRGRFLAFIACFLVFADGGRRFDANGGFIRYTSLRSGVFLLITLILAVALFLKWRHTRNVSGTADAQARDVPPELAASVKKACNEAESLGRAALAERWLMLYAVLALAVDPAQVKVEQVPGAAQSAA
ncbi:MAG TPA: protein kinase [Gemmatimonadales bacterium]|nr:protein kinase [Gemmatimonadales bacterium]